VCDDNYLYLTETMTDRCTERMFIYDHDMEPVDTVEYGGILPSDASFVICYPYPVQGEKFLIRCQTGIEDVWYWFDRAEIGSGDIELHEFFRCSWMDYMVTG